MNSEDEEEPGTEIKRQITGMMRLLSDKTSRVYQRTGAKGDDLKKDPQDYGPSWVQPPATLPHLPENHNWTHAAEPEPSSSCPIPIANGQRYTHETTSPPSSPEGPCCMHSCQGTLQAILQELRSMRRLMQTQQEHNPNQSSDATRRHHNPRTSSPARHLFTGPERGEEYDVFIPKAQLDSILLNYTRSGSLLFRKLVCAFFDDSTLANSLPNGKRKRGLNDNRKGLDQNIVGAIKG
uniref:BEN domain-containing protein n=1 Tax=Gadus morhua TaxID=8049 RepID=A0A8C4ZGA7_GADMO